MVSRPVQAAGCAGGWTGLLGERRMAGFCGRISRAVGIGLVVVATACGLGHAQGGDPAGPASACCTGTADVWLVSTRCLPDVGGLPRRADLHVERCTDPARGCWEPADLAGLLDDPARPLMIFIHGNRYEPHEAKAQGLRVNRRAMAACPATSGVRTVIFSWPSEQERHLLRDGRAKFARARTDGHYFGWFLGQVPPQQPVAIVAYSFGALITVTAFEDLVAAERSSKGVLQPWTDREGRTNVVFIAPAVRCDAFAPRGPYREALACCHRLSLIINSHDDALRFFPWLDPRVRLQALGYVGMPRSWVPADVEFSATDAANVVGRNHGLPLYLSSPGLTARIAGAALDGLGDGVTAPTEPHGP